MAKSLGRAQTSCVSYSKTACYPLCRVSLWTHWHDYKGNFSFTVPPSVPTCSCLLVSSRPRRTLAVSSADSRSFSASLSNSSAWLASCCFASASSSLIGSNWNMPRMALVLIFLGHPLTGRPFSLCVHSQTSPKDHFYIILLIMTTCPRGIYIPVYPLKIKGIGLNM